MTISEEKLQSLRAIHGQSVYLHEVGGLSFALKAAPEALVDRVFDIMFAGRMGQPMNGLGEALANLTSMSIVFPEAEARDALLSRNRGLAHTLGMVIYEHAMGGREGVEKKEQPSQSTPEKT